MILKVKKRLNNILIILVILIIMIIVLTKYILKYKIEITNRSLLNKGKLPIL